jgi:hypothetical protein
MSPEPYLRGMAFVLALLLVAAAVLGASVAALACAVTGTLVAWGLHRKYRHDVRVADVQIPPHRERLDLIVVGDARAALAIGVVASAFAVAFRPDDPHLVSAGVASASIPVAVAITTVYLSSLVDWYITLPRISGLLGARPCRPSTGDPPTFPATWRETTRWWYVHRIVAALVVRFGLAYAVTLAVSDLLGLGIESRLLGSAAVGSFSAYLLAIPWAVREAGHPHLIVGQTVRRQRMRRRSLWELRFRGRTILRVPSRKRDAVETTREREYVYDVSLEGVQVVPAHPRESRPTDDGATDYERNPKRIPLRKVDDADPARSFSGCDEVCSGINWYCIENPRCFEPK